LNNIIIKRLEIGAFILPKNKTLERNDFMNELQTKTKQTPIEIALKIDKEGKTTARNLYNFLELDKSNYSKWCRANIIDNQFAEEQVDYEVFVPKDENQKGGRPTTDFKLTASFAKKLSMMQKNEKGEQARQYFLGCEEGLKRAVQERQQWEIERAKGVVIRHILTDTIKMKVADSPHKKFMYPNYTKLIYKTLFDKSMKELQKKYQVKGKESIRDYLTAEQLKEVESMEMLVSSLINCGWGYDQIKNFIQENHMKQIAG
jgi:phage anti-repressor protein